MRLRVWLRFAWLAAILYGVYFAFSREPPPTRAIANATAITMLASSEKQEWLNVAREEFQRSNPEVSIQLSFMGSGEGAEAILEGRVSPQVWSPSDALILDLVRLQWAEKHRGELFEVAGEDAPKAMLITPLVILAWAERAEVLARSYPAFREGASLSWSALHEVLTARRGWQDLGGRPEWGRFRFGHTDPLTSNSGLQTLYLMTLEYFRNPAQLAPKVLDQPEYLAWMRSFEAAVPELPRSTDQLMQDFLRYGPSRYDFVAAYENLAIVELSHAQRRFGELRIYYPPLTAWSDHPVVILRPETIAPEMLEAVRSWLRFLLSKRIQELGISYGFRPADPRMPIPPSGPGSSRAFGLQLHPASLPSAPTTSVIKRLSELWEKRALRTLEPRDAAVGADGGVKGPEEAR